MRLGQVLVESGQLTPQQLDRVLAEQAHVRVRLGTLLIDLGLVGADDVATALASQLRTGAALQSDLRDSDPFARALIDARTAASAAAVPLTMDADRLVVAMRDPRNRLAINRLERLTKKSVQPRVAPEGLIHSALRRYYDVEPSPETLTDAPAEVAPPPVPLREHVTPGAAPLPGARVVALEAPVEPARRAFVIPKAVVAVALALIALAVTWWLGRTHAEYQSVYGVVDDSWTGVTFELPDDGWRRAVHRRSERMILEPGSFDASIGVPVRDAVYERAGLTLYVTRATVEAYRHMMPEAFRERASNIDHTNRALVPVRGAFHSVLCDRDESGPYASRCDIQLDDGGARRGATLFIDKVGPEVLVIALQSADATPPGAEIGPLIASLEW